MALTDKAPAPAPSGRVGPGGAALRAADNLNLPADARVVTILADRAERYYSTKLFAAQ